MFVAQENDTVGKAVCSLIDSAVPANQSLKETEFDWYVEDLQDEIITYFNYHKLAEVPQFLEKLIYFASYGSNTEDKKRRYAASVVLATIISLFPFDDYIPQFEPIIEQLLRPGFKRLVMVGAMVVGRIGYLSGMNRDHLVHVLVEKNAAILSSKAKPEQLFAAATVLKELAQSAPEHIFELGSQFHETISCGLQSGDTNVRDLCIQIVEILFRSQSASVGLFFLTDFLDLMRKAASKRLAESKDNSEIIANLKMLLILLKQKPYMSPELALELLVPVCVGWIQSPVFEIMTYSIEIIMFLDETGSIETEPDYIKNIVEQLFAQTPRHPKDIQKLFTDVIAHYPQYITNDLGNVVEGFKTLLKVLPKNSGPPLIFQLVVATIRIVPDVKQLSPLFEIVDDIMIQSTVPTPIHILLQTLNESKPDWNTTLRRYKQFLVRMIHEELSEPFQRWESIVISFNAIDELTSLSYPDAVMLHALVMGFADSASWQVRERVASSAIHLYHGYIDRLPLESMKRLVDLAVDDQVRSVRKKTLFSFKPEVYKFLAQPEIMDKFWRLIHDESFMVRKRTIEMLGELIPRVSASILRELLLTTLRQLPDKYNPIIPPRISDNFPHIIWASQSFLHLYAGAIYQRFLMMLNDRFNNPMYKDQSLVYMNSAQLRDIDGSIIKSLSRVNELCPQQCPSGPIIQVLSTILLQPVHPWTKTHALKALKNIAQGAEEVSYIVKDYPKLLQALLKLIHENSSIKLVTKSLKVLGAIGALDKLPPIMSKSKDIFIFRSFFTGSHEFKRYFLRIIFNYLFGMFDEPMIDSKKETIAKVITDLFVADPESVAEYLQPFVNVFLPVFSQAFAPKTLKVFFTCLSTVVKLAGRLIVPHVSVVFQAIEQHWRQQFTLEASRVIRALIEAAYGQCDAILHLVVPICFQLIKFKGQNSAPELFNLLRVVADYTPSYLSIIIQEISDIAGSPETPDTILGLCIKTLKFIVKRCDCVEFLPTIKRCVIKLKNNAGIKYRDAAASLLDAITEHVYFEDDEFEPTRPKAPNVSTDASQLIPYMVLPKDLDDVSLGKWYHNLESKLMEVTPSPVVRALIPLSSFPGLQPKFAFVFAFLTMWLNVTDAMKAQFVDLLNKIFKCDDLPSWIANQFVRLVEFSVLAEIDLRLDVATLITFCEKMHFYAKALLFVENSSPIFPIQKVIALNAAVNRKIEARSLAKLHNLSMDHRQWMELGDWESALKQIRKSVDPSRYIYHQVVCRAALEDWEGILQFQSRFNDLEYHDRVQIARYFMTAEMWSGNEEMALEYLNATNGFSVEDQIMRAVVLIKMGDKQKASQAVHNGWRYLAASVSAIEKCNKNAIQDQLFQAQELLELSEVLLCLRKPEYVHETNRVWRARLRNIENDPDKQKELFKIRSLVPNLPHFDAHMLDIISYYIWLGQDDVARRLADVFFPDEESYHRQYVELELSGREEKITEMLNLAETCNCQELGSRLQQLVGKIKLKKCSTIQGLKDVANHFILADKSQEKIANINILLAHATEDRSYSVLAAKALGKCIKTKPFKHVLFAQKLLAIATNFSNDEATCEAVYQSIDALPVSVLPSVMYTAFALLSHTSPNVQKVAYKVCQSLVANYAQYAGFQLLSMEQVHYDNECFEELYDKLQMDSPVTFSQVSLIATQLLRIQNPLHVRLSEKFAQAKEAMTNGDAKQALALVRAGVQLLNDPNLSLLDKQMKAQHESAIQKTWQPVKEKRVVAASDFDAFELTVSQMAKKFESMRVIRLSSVSEHLERKSKWNINVLGRQALEPEGVKLSKFFHCIGNLENGFQITLIGNDGKRYNYQMRNSKERPIAVHQFVNLIGSLISDVHTIIQGSIIELSEHLHLYEMPKNQISMYEMITLYRQSKQRITDPEELAIRTWTQASYSELDLQQRIDVLDKLGRNFDATELAHALLVTSRGADAWAHRTSQFASSLGVMSCVSYIVGTVNHSPHSFLIDKTTGAVTFSSFSGMEPKQPVPFRLTPMIENALGRYGIHGPFSRSYNLAIKEIRKRALVFAPLLEFLTCEPPFSPAKVPSNFLKGFGVEVEETESNELDAIYQRICGMEMSNEDEFNILCSKAKEVKSIAKMPADWCPWW